RTELVAPGLHSSSRYATGLLPQISPRSKFKINHYHRSLMIKKLSQGIPVTTSSRRELFQQSGRLLAAGALAGTLVPQVHAAEDNTLQVVLIGCGGRGTGATSNCLSVAGQGPIKLVGMADVFPHRLKGSLKNLS